MSDSITTVISVPDATNLEYVGREGRNIKIFFSYANSYYGKFISKLLSGISNDGSGYKIYGTLNESHPVKLHNVECLDPDSENFLTTVSQCDIILLDISQDQLQLQESTAIVDYLEHQLNIGTELTFKLVLISTILTWAKTAQKDDEIMTDLSYRKRRPHPCFNDHLLLERKVINLQKKFRNSVKSMVLCPGIVYGEEQDIFHYIFKSCFFNSSYVDVFMPGINYLPIIYIHDFVKIVLDLLTGSLPDISSNYILAVQPNPLNAFDIARIFAQAVSGSEIMIRICEKEEIFAMSVEKMTQRTYNHMTLNLRLESDYLKDFEFTVDGQNFEEYAEKIVTEFYDSRNLRPIKILIDGSPHTCQTQLAKMLSQFYCLHQVDNKCFLKNYQCRLALKIHYIEKYLSYMNEVASKCSEEALQAIKYKELISSNENRLKRLNQEKEKIDGFLLSKSHTFDDISEFLIEKLTSHGCSMHQGYVLTNFQLDSIMASKIFLDSARENFIEAIMPDYVIVINRTVKIDENCQDEHRGSDNVQQDLTDYYDQHDEEVSILNFFLDRGIVPIEITVNHDLNDTEIQEKFENLKLKIGHPHVYELSKDEQDEIDKIKRQIADKEAVEREKMEQKRAQEEFEETQKKLEEWNKQVMEEKEKEFLKIEQQSLPVRQYLMKYVLPKVTDAFLEVTRLRPDDPVKFIGNYLFQANCNVKCDSEIDQQIVDEFERLSKCDAENEGTENK